LIQNKRPQAGL